MSTQVSKSNAKRLTLAYQLVAGVCVLGAGAIGVLGLPESSAPAIIGDVSHPSIAQNTGANSTGQTPSRDLPSSLQTQISPNSIAARLAMLDNAPRGSVIVDQSPTASDTVAQIPDTTNLGSIAKRVRYTGYIDEGNRKLAFISIDGVQRIVAQGSTAMAGSQGLDDLHIKIVRPHVILVTNGTIEQRIDLADKTGASVTMSSGSDFVIAETPVTDGDVVYTPEELEELSKLKPRARAAKERMLRRQKLGIPPKGLDMTPLASFKAGLKNKPANSRNNRNESE